MKITLLLLLALLPLGCASPTAPDGSRPCWSCVRAAFRLIDYPGTDIVVPYCRNWRYGPEPCIGYPAYTIIR